MRSARNSAARPPPLSATPRLLIRGLWTVSPGPERRPRVSVLGEEFHQDPPSISGRLGCYPGSGWRAGSGSAPSRDALAARYSYHTALSPIAGPRKIQPSRRPRVVRISQDRPPRKGKSNETRRKAQKRHPVLVTRATILPVTLYLEKEVRTDEEEDPHLAANTGVVTRPGFAARAEDRRLLTGGASSARIFLPPANHQERRTYS